MYIYIYTYIYVYIHTLMNFDVDGGATSQGTTYTCYVIRIYCTYVYANSNVRIY